MDDFFGDLTTVQGSTQEEHLQVHKRMYSKTIVILPRVMSNEIMVILPRVMSNEAMHMMQCIAQVEVLSLVRIFSEELDTVILQQQVLLGLIHIILPWLGLGLIHIILPWQAPLEAQKRDQRILHFSTASKTNS